VDREEIAERKRRDRETLAAGAKPAAPRVAAAAQKVTPAAQKLPLSSLSVQRDGADTPER
jgi:hypothetical protein